MPLSKRPDTVVRRSHGEGLGSRQAGRTPSRAARFSWTCDIREGQSRMVGEHGATRVHGLGATALRWLPALATGFYSGAVVGGRRREPSDADNLD